MVTLNQLIEFTPNDDDEREMFEKCKSNVINEYLSDTKSTWSNGTFYLGGFMKMKPNEEITLKKIDEVKIMREQRDKEYGEPCNSSEHASILRSKRQLDEIETLVNFYSVILRHRYLKELAKTNLNYDVNNIIVSYT